MDSAGDPYLAAGAQFVANVEPRGRIVAGHHNGEAGTHAMLPHQAIHPNAHLVLNLAGGLPAVEQVSDC